MFDCFGGFLVEQATRPPSPPGLMLAHRTILATRPGRFGGRVVRDGSRQEDWRRQFGGSRSWNFEGLGAFARAMSRVGMASRGGVSCSKIRLK